jgi:hypothetical protein
MDYELLLLYKNDGGLTKNGGGEEMGELSVVVQSTIDGEPMRCLTKNMKNGALNVECQGDVVKGGGYTKWDTVNRE